MAPKGGRLEARITVPTAGWVFDTEDSANGPQAQTINQGHYYAGDLVDAVGDTITNGSNWSVTLSGGEGTPGTSTGRVTINCTDTPFSINWADDDLREAMGFLGNIVAATSPQTGEHCVRGLWLPGVLSKYSRHGDGDAGVIVSDARQTVGPTGVVKTLFSNSRRELRSVRWEGVPAQRAKEHLEVIDGESFEAFYQAAHLARYSFIPVGAMVRLIWDADSPGSYCFGKLLWPRDFDPQNMVDGWTGRYTIALPTMVFDNNP